MYDRDRITPIEAGIATRPRSALELTMEGLGRSLRSIGVSPSVADRANTAVDDLMRRPSDAMDVAVRRINDSVRRTIRSLDALEIEVMLREPYRITLAVYGARVSPAIWPVAGKTTKHVLADCIERQSRQTGHNMQRVHELRQARAALEIIVEQEEI